MSYKINVYKIKKGKESFMKHLNQQKKRAGYNYKVMLIAFVIAVLATVLLLCSFNPTEVYALTNTGSAYQAGGGQELWDASAGAFNDDVLEDITKKLFDGVDDPVAYVKTFTESQTGAHVVPAPTINAKVGNTTNGMVIKLGGKLWMAASLTLADVGEEEDEKDNVVLTLYLANADGTSKFYDTANTSGVGTKGENMYSSSRLRYNLLTGSNWSLFNTTNADGDTFAQKYLVQPKNVEYQHTQSSYGRYIDGGRWTASNKYPYRWPNEALDDTVKPSGSVWHSNYSNPYKANYTRAGAFSTAQRYDAWGEDYIWIPSWSETGDNTCMKTTSSIWQLTNEQRAHSTTASYTWWRSGRDYRYNYAYCMAPSGVQYYNSVTYDYGVRPALHLNLTSAALGAAGRGVTPTEDSGYNYVYKDSNNTRQDYATTKLKHLSTDEQDKVPTGPDGKKRYVLGYIKPETKLSDFVSNLKNEMSLLKIYDQKDALIFDGTKGGGVTTVPESAGKKIVTTGFKVEAYKKVKQDDGTEKLELYDTVWISVLGDVTCDGIINTLDITIINRIARGELKLSDLNHEQQLAAMIDNKGNVTSTDGKILFNVIGGITNLDSYFTNIVGVDKYQMWNLNTADNKVLRTGTDITAAANLVSNGIIGNIPVNTTASAFKTKLANQASISVSSIAVYKANGTLAGNNDFVGTGSYITYSGKTIYLCVLGDLTGDGIANALDATILNKIINGSIKLNTSVMIDKVIMLASTIQNKGNITTADSECILNYIGGYIDLSKYFLATTT